MSKYDSQNSTLNISISKSESKENESNSKFLKCVLCLNLINYPMQCSKCDTLLCQLCVNALNFEGNCSFRNCTGYYKKANKLLREYLSCSTVRCSRCLNDIDYPTYISPKHMLECFNEQCLREKLLKTLKINEDNIKRLEEEINILKVKHKIYNKYNLGKFTQLSMEALRTTLMSFDLTIEQKMELYYACTEGKLELFESLIKKKKFPLLEEISYKNYYWTPLHYAMHYGQYEIICFILSLLKEDNLLQPAMRIQSNDGRCPLMCLLKSTNLLSTKKEEIFEKLIKSYSFEISKEVKKEATTRGLDKILKKLGK